VPLSGTVVGAGTGHAVSIGVGLALVPEVGTGVGVAGVPGHSEMLWRNGPGVADPAHTFTATPP
jgi:hypothetical protein